MHAESAHEKAEQAETKLMGDMAFLKMQHQQYVEQLKTNYNAEVSPNLCTYVHMYYALRTYVRMPKEFWPTANSIQCTPHHSNPLNNTNFRLFQKSLNTDFQITLQFGNRKMQQDKPNSRIILVGMLRLEYTVLP